ncbi:hypothetical protein IscW_ISCW000958 [Ixodes scapularis]|uniref:Uncharacterized protein n=1 Tax=Ixodes scapularis TaxID=6945 RepID=B7P7E0_IXOSC|nr:hypothetical protein IscW_ISCW000958 [Ixodes scapularis]|eukprot:XP_002410059.1 hypothetical protein IscW_ISCW000958 [Ixodes scapularis]
MRLGEIPHPGPSLPRQRPWRQRAPGPDPRFHSRNIFKVLPDNDRGNNLYAPWWEGGAGQQTPQTVLLWPRERAALARVNCPSVGRDIGLIAGRVCTTGINLSRNIIAVDTNDEEATDCPSPRNREVGRVRSGAAARHPHQGP